MSQLKTGDLVRVSSYLNNPYRFIHDNKNGYACVIPSRYTVEEYNSYRTGTWDFTIHRYCPSYNANFNNITPYAPSIRELI